MFLLMVWMGRSVRCAGIACLALWSSVAAGVGQEVCVECSEPLTVYKCSIEKSDKIRHFGNSERIIRYGCVKALAKLGNHSSCRASQTSKGTCDGKPVQLTVNDLLKIPEPTETTLSGGGNRTPVTNQGEQAPAGQAQKSDGPPRTMKELAENAFSKQGLQDAGKSVNEAGKAVGGAVKKTWDCLTSLFSGC